MLALTLLMLISWMYPRDASSLPQAMDTSIVSGERVVFNINGNDDRLIVAVDFEKVVWIKWIGTHRDYDKIDAKEFGMVTEIRPIRMKRDYEAALKEIKPLWGLLLCPPSASMRVAHIPACRPDGSTRSNRGHQFLMEQQGLTRRDLEQIIGTRTRIAEVLNRKRGCRSP